MITMSLMMQLEKWKKLLVKYRKAQAKQIKKAHKKSGKQKLSFQV